MMMMMHGPDALSCRTHYQQASHWPLLHEGNTAFHLVAHTALQLVTQW
jgi:hypothetical protein